MMDFCTPEGHLEREGLTKGVATRELGISAFSHARKIKCGFALFPATLCVESQFRFANALGLLPVLLRAFAGRDNCGRIHPHRGPVSCSHPLLNPWLTRKKKTKNEALSWHTAISTNVCQQRIL